MSGNDINRRDFLKILGWSGVGVAVAGCDRPTTVTLEEGKEEVVAYLQPEEYVIPGVGVWFASTCQQCPAGCGVHGRVREGRVLNMEGNPDSQINKGKLCQMGQAGGQGHYNPDRLKKPMLRKGGALAEVSWEEALAALEQKVGPASGLAGDRFAWFTGTVSGHQSVLLSAHLAAMGSKNHFIHETINNAVARTVNQDMLGEAMPRYDLPAAKMVLSFGADLVGTGSSPVHFSGEYAKFRTGATRGVLVQVEPKMTLTGGSADLWVAIRPGTEGVLALGIANQLLLGDELKVAGLPENLRTLITGYNLEKVAGITGVTGDRITRIAKLLKERSPSLVLAGASVEGHAHGYQSAAAIMVLNIVLGNVGKTILPSGSSAFPQMEAKAGGTRDLLALADAADKKALDVVFFHGANPVYTAPAALGLTDKLKNIPFKVVFAVHPDETAMNADLVLPILSAHEDWGTHMGVYQPEQKSISIQQPLMERLYPDTKGFGDLLLALLKARQVKEYESFADYYGYLKNAFAALPASVKGDSISDEDFWGKSLQKGVLNIGTVAGALNPKMVEISFPEFKSDAPDYYLVPSAQLGLWDGRHANLPWLQEAPDQISKVVWNSWVEMHPATAAKLGVKEGDFVKVSSAQGAVEAQVYVYKGIHPQVIAVPMGQGHEEYGRYAKGRGVNPLKILAPVVDAKTGELSLYGTRVTVAQSGRREVLVKLMGSETQLGRKMVSTVTASVFNRTEGTKNVT